MRCSALLLACAALLACDDPGMEPAAPPAVQPPYFVVFGTVRDQAGLPIAGAIAEIVTGSHVGLSALSNEAGHFSLRGVHGPMVIQVWKEWYSLSEHIVDVTGDVPIEVTLADLPYGDTIVVGQRIRYLLPGDAAPCDPVRWDARAPCRRLRFAPQSAGALVITVTWKNGSPIDVVITTTKGEYLAASDWGDSEEAIVSAYVNPDETYEIRVSSYYNAQVFDLKADLHPLTGTAR